MPALVLELLHRADQPDVALLDQVLEGDPHVAEVLGDRDDQLQVVLDEDVLHLEQAVPLELDLVHALEEGRALDADLALEPDEPLAPARDVLLAARPGGLARRRALLGLQAGDAAQRLADLAALLEQPAAHAAEQVHREVRLLEQAHRALVVLVDPRGVARRERLGALLEQRVDAAQDGVHARAQVLALG